jgi:hypothetical protein
MAEILILSLLALAIAAYQALRPADRKRIKYAFSTRGKRIVLSSVGLIVILYLIGRYIETANPSFRLFCDFGCLPALFWIDILQVLAVVMIFYIGKRILIDDPPKVVNDDRLATVLRDFYTGKQYGALLNVIEDNFEHIFLSGDGDQSSGNTVQRALLSDEVATTLATTNPDLGLRIISNGSDWFPRQEFADRYLRSLHEEQSSILYREIRNNRNGEYDNYSIETGNELLDTLFDDCSIAEELLVWKPIGDRTIELLEAQSEKEHDEYNNRNERFSIFHERVVFRDPIFISIRYFNIMLIQGLKNDADSHMWVSYLEGFIKHMCENFQNLPQVESSDEFVNDYHYLINNIFDTLTSIIETVTNTHRPSYSNIQQPDTTTEPDIIKMSIWTLLLCYKHVIETSSISSETQRMLSEKVFDCYLELAGGHTTLSDNYHTSMHAFFVQDNPMNPVAGRSFNQFQREALSDLRSYDTVSIHSDPKRDAYDNLESSLI